LKVRSQQEIAVVDLVKSALLQEVDRQDQKLIPRKASKRLDPKYGQNLAHLEAQKLETAPAVDRPKAKA
jgi:hypothetical protein